MDPLAAVQALSFVAPASAMRDLIDRIHVTPASWVVMVALLYVSTRLYPVSPSRSALVA